MLCVIRTIIIPVSAKPRLWRHHSLTTSENKIPNKWLLIKLITNHDNAQMTEKNNHQYVYWFDGNNNYNLPWLMYNLHYALIPNVYDLHINAPL